MTLQSKDVDAPGTVMDIEQLSPWMRGKESHFGFSSYLLSSKCYLLSSLHNLYVLYATTYIN